MGFWIKCAFREVKLMLSLLSALLAVICIVDFNALFPELWQRVLLVLLILAAVLLIGIVKTISTRKVIVDLGADRKGIIEFGDLFAKGKGKRIVIPVNDAFDTVVDDVSISRGSIHGQFVMKVFKGTVPELDFLMEEQLKNVKPAGLYGPEKDGKKKYYPLGTVVHIEQGGKIYYLLALTHFRGNRVEENPLGYYQAVLKLIECLNNYKAGNPVFIPLLGSGLGRLSGNKAWVLRNLISVFRMSKTPLTDDVHIVVHRDSIWEKISLNAFKE